MRYILIFFINVLPCLLLLYAFVRYTYDRLKAGATLTDFINHITGNMGLTLSFLYLVTPVINWGHIFINRDVGLFSTYITPIFQKIKIFIREFILAMWLLILWMTGIKYIFNILNKIFSIKIK